MADYPLQALRELLRSPAVTRGVVVKVTGARVKLATARGIQVALAGGSLMVGQTVVVRDGAAYPAAAASDVYAL